jgi:hypothetical protein
MSPYRQPDDGRRCAECDEPFSKHFCQVAFSAPDGAWTTGLCCTIECADKRAERMRNEAEER